MLRCGGLSSTSQQVWGLRYIDDAVARRIDHDGNRSFTDILSANPETQPHARDRTYGYLTDHQFSVVAVVEVGEYIRLEGGGASATVVPFAEVQEWVHYDPYGFAEHRRPGDVDNDGDVTVQEATIFALFAANWGGVYDARYDLNRDGVIDSEYAAECGVPAPHLHASTVPSVLGSEACSLTLLDCPGPELDLDPELEPDDSKDDPLDLPLEPEPLAGPDELSPEPGASVLAMSLWTQTPSARKTLSPGTCTATVRTGSSPLPRPRRHGLDDSFGAEVVKVADGGGQRGVAELSLDDGDVDPLGPQLGGVGVAEAVGVDAAVEARASADARQLHADVAGGDGLAGAAAEDPAVRAVPERLAGAEPDAEQGRAAGVDADGAGAAALGVQDTDRARVEIQVLDAQEAGLVSRSPAR